VPDAITRCTPVGRYSKYSIVSMSISTSEIKKEVQVLVLIHQWCGEKCDTVPEAQNIGFFLADGNFGGSVWVDHMGEKERDLRIRKLRSNESLLLGNPSKSSQATLINKHNTTTL